MGVDRIVSCPVAALAITRELVNELSSYLSG